MQQEEILRNQDLIKKQELLQNLSLYIKTYEKRGKNKITRVNNNDGTNELNISYKNNTKIINKIHKCLYKLKYLGFGNYYPLYNEFTYLNTPWGFSITNLDNDFNGL
jgi:hypothetical protein